MKKILKYMVIALVIFAPSKIKAFSANLTLSCPQEVEMGSDINCDISATTSGDISGITANYNFGGLSYVGFACASSNGLCLGEEEGVGVITMDVYPASFNIGTLKLALPSSAKEGDSFTISFTNIDISNSADEEAKGTGNSAVVKIRTKSTNNNLKSLTVSGGSIDFNPNTTSYKLTVDADKVSISASAEDGHSTVEGTGEKSLNYGDNTFNIVVTSESGISKTYTITITRPKKDTGGSQVAPPSETTKPDNKPSEEQSKKSNNTDLYSLKVNGKNLKLTKDKTDYELTVEYDVEELELDYKTDDTKASVKLDGDKKLKVGENTIKLIVTAEDGSTKTYTLIVTRAEEGKKVSSNNYLKSLEVSKYDLDFSKNQLDYTLKIKDEDKLDIKTVAEDSKAKVRVIGNEDLKDGSKIRILVTAEDGSSREYTITISKSKNMIPIIALVIVLIVLVVATILLIINRKKRN